MMGHDSMTDERVKKKLLSVLASWHRQFKEDPRMSVIAGLYQAVGGGQKKVCVGSTHFLQNANLSRYRHHLKPLLIIQSITRSNERERKKKQENDLLESKLRLKQRKRQRQRRRRRKAGLASRNSRSRSRSGRPSTSRRFEDI